MRTEKNEFDAQVGKILSDAREEVPGRLWEGVCARMDAKASRAGWLVTTRRISYGLLAAAAAVALLLTIPGLLDTENNNTDTYSKDYSLAEAVSSGQDLTPAEEVAPEAPSSKETGRETTLPSRVLFRETAPCFRSSPSSIRWSMRVPSECSS